MRLAPLARLPSAALGILREATRLILRRPVLGIVAAARVPDGRWVLIRRADFGTWALPGGTLEWGETISEALPRELLEEAGVELREMTGLVGIFSRPDRDPRFHGVTVVIRCEVEMPMQSPMNPLEIEEVGLFEDTALPPELALGTGDMLAAARAGGPPVIE
jgi:8-oxo-dGTP diphosphatase